VLSCDVPRSGERKELRIVGDGAREREREREKEKEQRKKERKRERERFSSLNGTPARPVEIVGDVSTGSRATAGNSL